MKSTRKTIEEAIPAIRESALDSSVYIGCDSIRFKDKGEWWICYSTVVVLHRNSKHGGAIFSENKYEKQYSGPSREKPTNGLHQRLMTEVTHALDVYDRISEVIGNRNFEIHLDINSNELHASNQVVKMALGWVKSYPSPANDGGLVGDRAKIKPYAWCASHAADHVVRKPKKIPQSA